ncbi:PREDICTED: uncharacterized protein LOC109474462 [Branchiostoma belcheri]|uniref:Uncharacterized protein LOC109474462 n=1 Tax=Branchiostoma belcheri TaxID=7741 RepID=A0A6P4Z8V9_BRABE|nr:PREDICTED: uncharacterized protein LOC109474462 [Branchiostoma belcheri]
MAGWKIVVCVLGSLGGLFIATAVDAPCKTILSPGGIPVDQCLGDYVCHNGTCGERSQTDKLATCLLPKTESVQTQCPVRLPGLEISRDFLVDLVNQVVTGLNDSLCSGEYWNIGYHVTGQLDTGGKCSQRFNREIAGCSQQFLQKFLTGNASSDVLCREYGRSLQCIKEWRRTECCFTQTELAMLSHLHEYNPFCQCPNVTSSAVAMATERPNNMAATVPFSQRGPACNNVNMPKSTNMPTSSSSRLHLFTHLMIFNFVLSAVRWTNCG